MKNNSTVAANTNEIFMEAKLTIGLDLGDRFSHYCILDEAGNVILEHQADNTEGNPASLQQDPAQSDRTRNRDPLTLGKPAVEPDGPRSDRGACA